MKKILKQGLNVTTTELRKLADELDNEILMVPGITKKDISKIKHLIAIINNEPKCSDTWFIKK